MPPPKVPAPEKYYIYLVWQYGSVIKFIAIHDRKVKNRVNDYSVYKLKSVHPSTSARILVLTNILVTSNSKTVRTLQYWYRKFSNAIVQKNKNHCGIVSEWRAYSTNFDRSKQEAVSYIASMSHRSCTSFRKRGKQKWKTGNVQKVVCEPKPNFLTLGGVNLSLINVN